MIKVDWSNAPDGYPLWITPMAGYEKWPAGWHKESTDAYVDQRGCRWHKTCEGSMFEVHRYSPWNGEGIPPAGIDVEFSVAGDSRWIEGEVLYSSLYTVVISGNGFEHVHHPSVVKFRPIRTPEQIAADERESAINGMLTHDALGGSRRGLAEALYDAGYRKQDAK